MKPGHESLPIRIVRAFLGSNLSLILILLSMTVGAVALMVTPREEEPQIVVPVADIYVSFPGHSAREVEQLVSTRLEKYLFQIDGVEYVYSRSLPGKSIVTVRFFVGQEREKSLVKLRKWLDQNADRIPAGVTGYVVKPVETDDVPILTLTFTSPHEDDYSLRRIAEEVLDRLQSVTDAGITSIIGGRPRQILVRPDPEAMAAFRVTPLDIHRALSGADVNFQAGEFSRMDRQLRVEAGRFLSSKQDVESLVVGVSADKTGSTGSSDRPVYLKDVAQVTDGPGEVTSYVRFSAGPAWTHRKEAGAAGQWIGGASGSPEPPVSQPAVTIAIAKQKGTNNVRVAQDILARMETIQKEVVPDDVQVAITRNYGITANAKVNELVEGLVVGVVVVIALLTMSTAKTNTTWLITLPARSAGDNYVSQSCLVGAYGLIFHGFLSLYTHTRINF
jgi:multidrug efflux pump subunit AcrB